jgi:arylsulfatase A-like enzyme
MVQNKPNILLFLTDQHTLDALGCYGETPCKTPNVDQLAEEGIRFINHYTISPLCSPARASIMTGLEVHKHGITTNVHEMGCSVSEIPDSPDLLSRKLQEAGYNCGYTGKWHLGDGESETRGGVKVDPSTSTKRGFIGQDTPQNKGGWYFEDFQQYLRDIGLEEEAENYKNHKYGGLDGQSIVVDHPLEGTCEYYLTENTIHLINNFKNDNKPFFIWHNTWGPHGDYISHRSFYEMYRDLDIPEPPHYRLDPSQEYLPSVIYRSKNQEKDWEYFAEYIREYYSLVTQIDAMLGRIVDHLKKEKLYDNTVIIFTSDHGSHMGYHGGLENKGFSHYEEAQRTGLIIMDPRTMKTKFEAGLKPGDTVAEPTSLLDLYPTILAFAEAVPNKEADGQSLIPLMKGENVAWRDHSFVEFYGLGEVLTTMLTIRYQNIKYGWNATNKDELYDLDKDPLETINLIDHPDYGKILQNMRERMYQHLVEHKHSTSWVFNQMVLEVNK